MGCPRRARGPFSGSWCRKTHGPCSPDSLSDRLPGLERRPRGEESAWMGFPCLPSPGGHCAQRGSRAEGLGEGLRYLSAGCIWKPTWAVGAERTWVFSEPKGRFSGPENPCLSVSGFDSCLLICVSVCRFQASLSLRSIFYTFFLCEQVRDAPPPASHTAQVITPPFTQVAEPGELSVNPSSKFPGQRIPLAQPAGRVCPPSNRLWPWVGSQSTDMAPGKGQLLDLI